MPIDKQSILFKKIVGRVSPTLNTLDYYEEIAKKTNDLVELSQIWIDSSNVPPTNPLVASAVNDEFGIGHNGLTHNIIKKVQVRLYRLQGTGSTSSTYVETIGNAFNQPAKDFNDRQLTNIVNNNIFGFTYSPRYYNTSNTEINIYDVNFEGFFDYGSGVLSFYGNSFYNSNYIDVVAYKYIGKFGDEILSLINNAGGNPSKANKYMIANTATTSIFEPALDRNEPSTYILANPQNGSHVHVELNGVGIRLANGLNVNTNLDLDGKEFDCIFSDISDSKNVIASTTNQISISALDMIDLNPLLYGYIEIIDNANGVHIRRVNAIGIQTIDYIGADVINPSSVRRIDMRAWNDVVAGDMLRWHGSYANYEIESDDVFSYHYSE